MKAEDFLKEALKADGESMAKPEALIKEETCRAAGEFMAKRWYEKTNQTNATIVRELLSAITNEEDAETIKILYEELWEQANPFDPVQATLIEEARRKTLEQLQDKIPDEDLLNLVGDLPNSLTTRPISNLSNLETLLKMYQMQIAAGNDGGAELGLVEAEIASQLDKVTRLQAALMVYLVDANLGGVTLSESFESTLQQLNRLANGVVWKVQLDGTVLPDEFTELSEAQAFAESVGADKDDIIKNSDPISAAWDEAPVGGLDRSNTDYQSYFRNSFLQFLLPLLTQHIKTDVVTLEGFFTEMQFDNLYGRVADYLDLTDQETVMQAAMAKQQPPWRAQKKVTLEEYLRLYKKPIEVIFTEDNQNIEAINPLDSWLEPDFGIGTTVRVWQDMGNYVVVWPEDHPETRTDTLLLPKTCLTYYQPIEIPNVSETPELTSEELQVIRDRKEAQKSEQLRRKALRLDINLKVDNNLTTMINFATGELRQFTQEELFAGAAGFEFQKTRLVKMGNQVLPVCLATLINICADKNLPCQIVENGSGGPLKVEVPTALLKLITRMGDPLRAQVGENKVVVTY